MRISPITLDNDIPRKTGINGIVPATTPKMNVMRLVQCFLLAKAMANIDKISGKPKTSMAIDDFVSKESIFHVKPTP